MQLIDAALRTISGGPPQGFTDAELREIEGEVLAELLAADAAERADGDDRRHLQTADDRSKWPDLEPAVIVQGISYRHLRGVEVFHAA